MVDTSAVLPLSISEENQEPPTHIGSQRCAFDHDSRGLPLTGIQQPATDGNRGGSNLYITSSLSVSGCTKKTRMKGSTQNTSDKPDLITIVVEDDGRRKRIVDSYPC